MKAGPPATETGRPCCAGREPPRQPDTAPGLPRVRAASGLDRHVDLEGALHHARRERLGEEELHLGAARAARSEEELAGGGAALARLIPGLAQTHALGH